MAAFLFFNDEKRISKRRNRHRYVSKAIANKVLSVEAARSDEPPQKLQEKLYISKGKCERLRRVIF